MEVAGQWRREWAGTAEYGKVTEGGVTRRIARAMEVLHASAPGARVRVMRAAYHSSAGPGVPASSYMLHSSRRVISSGFNFLEPSPLIETQPTKPLEISSTPLESTFDGNIETENYKVTEPDDTEISEPSKWRASTSGNSIRMPSEESSSTDNASIIDLDPRTNHKSVFRKYSYDSECSDAQSVQRSSSRVSPLLDAPTSLSTLKYKSLLNGTSEWNSRRKSYSFEDTSPLNESILHSNDTLAMESSTDSGICKSSELVNDHSDENPHLKYYDKKDKKHEDSFRDWLAKNRTNSLYKEPQLKSYREHKIVLEDPVENNITLQSTGKVSITLPITIEKDDEYQYKKNHGSEDRKVKKVEFCKTELHFAAESGKVNIIATDEKPPPSNDFRRRRSAFVPLNNNFEKPITLFGEKGNDFVESKNFVSNISEFGESDENTAATKSILKNKIPKPKPYLLGENMAFGQKDDFKHENLISNDSPVATAVCLINSQLQAERKFSETVSSNTEPDINVIKSNSIRTASKGPTGNDVTMLENCIKTETISSSQEIIQTSTASSVKNKIKVLQMSPVQTRAKTRQLRESDLTYFGIDNALNAHRNKNISENRWSPQKAADDNILHSVKLIQQISNSACNSEAESDDTPNYQNIPLKTNFAPVPIPRSRTKFSDNSNEYEEVRILNPIIEQDNETKQMNNAPYPRRSRLRRQEETVTYSSRSISEPPKNNRHIPAEKSQKRYDYLRKNDQRKGSPSPRSKISHVEEENADVRGIKTISSKRIHKNEKATDDIPIYVNVEEDNIKQKESNCHRSAKKGESHQKSSLNSNKSSRNNYSHAHNSKSSDSMTKSKPRENERDSLRKKQTIKTHHPQRTEKLATPDYSSNRKIVKEDSIVKNISNEIKCDTEEKNNSHRKKPEHRSRSSNRPSVKDLPTESLGEPRDKLHSRRDSKVINDTISSNDSKSPTRRTYKNVTKEHPKTQQLIDPIKVDHHYHSSKSKPGEKNDKYSSTKSNDHKPRRSEYVISYDDKNGTMSSIRKIKSGPAPSRKKKVIKEIINEDPNDHKSKNKTIDKITLRNAASRSTMETKRTKLRR